MPTSSRSALACLLLFLLALVTVNPATGQAPTTINYQGRLLENTADQDAVDGTIDVVFSIWTEPTGGTELWSESWTGVPLSNGIFSVLLGSNGSPLDPADFQADSSLYLELEVGGETLAPRQALGSAPFAIVDEPENEIQDLALSGNDLTLTLDPSPTAIDLSPYLDDTDEQDLSLSGNTLSLENDPSPVDLSGYLDNTDAQTLSLVGDTLTISGSGSSVDLAEVTEVSNLSSRISALEAALTRTVFMTSVRVPGNFGGVAIADGICQAAADAVDLDGVFLAWLSGGDVSPSNRFDRLGWFELVDGTRIASDWSDLTDGTIYSAISLTESGGTPALLSVWTGTNADGTAAPQRCGEWTLSSGTGVFGSGSSTDSSWSNDAFSSCISSSSLICVEQVVIGIDDQQLTLSGNVLTLSSVDGTDSIDLSPYLDDTDNQVLSLSGNTLSLTSDDGTDSVSLAAFANTDAQTLSLSGNTLTISGSGSSVNLSGYLDNTDNQNLDNVLALGSDANNRDITNLDDVDIDKLTVDNRFTCTDCIKTSAIDGDTIGGNDIQDNIYILHIDCNGSCNGMSMRQACNVIENLRGLSVEVELIGVSCAHAAPSTSGNGFVPCDDGTQVFGSNECLAFNLRTLSDLPCVNGDGTDVIVTCLETDIAK